MYKSVCLICKTQFEIPYSDFRYKDIKYHRDAHHTCDKCGKMVQDECQKITGLTPEVIDFWDKVLTARSR